MNVGPAAATAERVLVERILGPGGGRVARVDGQQGVAGRADVWVVDVDANYWCTKEALGAIESTGAPHPVVVVHHVGWPTARRDHYVDPTALPAADVHPYTALFGVRPGTPEPRVGGVRGDDGSAWAVREGGPGNGVRTALEDHLAAAPDRRAQWYPVSTGLAVVWSAEDPAADAIAQRLSTWCDGELLAVLDEERVRALTRIAELEDVVADAGDGGPRLRGENARLRDRVVALEETLAVIAEDADQLTYSSVLRAIDTGERVARRTRPGASFRQRLLAIRDRARAAGADG